MAWILSAALLTYVCVWATSNTVGLGSLAFTSSSILAALLWLITAWICYSSARYQGNKQNADSRAEQKRRARQRGNFTEEQQITNFHCMSRGLSLMLIPQGFLVVYYPGWIKALAGIATLIVGLILGSVWGLIAGAPGGSDSDKTN